MLHVSYLSAFDDDSFSSPFNNSLDQPPFYHKQLTINTLSILIKLAYIMLRLFFLKKKLIKSTFGKVPFGGMCFFLLYHNKFIKNEISLSLYQGNYFRW